MTILEIYCALCDGMFDRVLAWARWTIDHNRAYKAVGLGRYILCSFVGEDAIWSENVKISSNFVQEMQARRRTSSSHKESHEEVPSEVEEGEKRDKKWSLWIKEDPSQRICQYK